MVKDILREIKRKWFQFLAIALITALGVGFFVGIQVTGYDMRQTGDAYAKEANIMDFQALSTLGFDDKMVEDINDLIDGKALGVKNFDAFAKSSRFDDVLHVINLDDNTIKDLTLVEGRLAVNDGEIVLDDQLRLQEKVSLGDTIRIVGNDQVNTHDLEVVGFVDSSLYMNLERGQSRLGSGSVAGFGYSKGSDFKEDLFTSVRVVSDVFEKDKARILENQEGLLEKRFDRLIAPTIQELVDAQKDLEQGKIDAQVELDKAWSTLRNARIQLDDSFNEISLGISEVANLTFTGTLDQQLTEARVHSKAVFDLTLEELQAKKETVLAMEDPELQKPLLAEIEAGLLELEKGRSQVDAAYNAIELSIKEVNRAEIEYSSGVSSYYQEKSKVERELENAQKEIDDAYIEIDNTSRGEIFTLTRSESIIGYDDFYQDSERIEGIGKVFPLIFFGVAILVTLSTVSRMVDESRMQIGIYKALGYSWLRTSMKYVGFTFLAWIIGASLGLYIGFMMIPHLIYDAYRIMYLTPELIGGFVWSYAYIPLIVSFISSVGVSFFKSLQTSREKAASLLVLPVPKGGQRIFLERVGFIWKRLSFLYKVSLRNLFRNKTRFLMTVVGIGGCCGLLLTGFGLKHSIYSIVDKQFDDVINYDGLVAYQEDWNLDSELFVDYARVYSDNVRINDVDVSVFAAEDLKQLSSLVHMNDKDSFQSIDLDENSVVLTEKIARMNNLEVGDAFTFRVDNKNYDLVLTDIVENYIAHYIYISQDLYESILGKELDSNLSLFTYAGDDEALSADLLEDDRVLSVNLLGNMKVNYLETMGNFDIVIIVIVGAAFLLELIVLLNLITMNMSERSKELATLKVLGFYPKELSSYILRENILLTLISLIVGVFFGKVLHNFVIVSAEINMVMFNREILWDSYVLAVGLTFGLSLLINVFMSKRSNKVNMAEALKL